MKPIPDEWKALLDELRRRTEAAEAMGGPERLSRQASRGRLDARDRIARLVDPDSFSEMGALGGSADPAGGDPVPADALIGGTARIDGLPVVVMSEDFTVMGGSIGHVNSAKRLRLVSLAEQEGLPFVMMLDGAGERASNALERYPRTPSDLQALADLNGRVPIVSLVLGASAGHGALCALFADLIVMTENASLFAAGPPLVKASIGVDATPEELGGYRIHTQQSGVVHNAAPDEDAAFDIARRFLGHLTTGGSFADDGERRIDEILEVVPANHQRPYDMRRVLDLVSDEGTLLELQPDFGTPMITALARIGGISALIVANQPTQMAGSITAPAAEKAAHFLGVAGSFGLPVVFFADNPGVMPGPDAEKAGTLRAASRMYAAQRAVRASKVHVTLRKAFGFGSSLMGMNPFDHQTQCLAFPGISLGGVPAGSGADASGASDEERAQLIASQSGAWTAADNNGYDRVIDPRELRNEVLRALRLRND